MRGTRGNERASMIISGRILGSARSSGHLRLTPRRGRAAWVETRRDQMRRTTVERKPWACLGYAGGRLTKPPGKTGPWATSKSFTRRSGAGDTAVRVLSTGATAAAASSLQDADDNDPSAAGAARWWQGTAVASGVQSARHITSTVGVTASRNVRRMARRRYMPDAANKAGSLPARRDGKGAVRLRCRETVAVRWGNLRCDRGILRLELLQ